MTDVVSFDPAELVELAPDEAFTRLWGMLQAEDETPQNIVINHLLNQIANGWNQMLGDMDQLKQQLHAAVYAARGLEFNLQLATQKAEEIATDANRKARNDLVNIIASQQNLSEDTVRLILDYLAGEGDWGINGYAQRILDRAITEAGAEIEDFIGISSYKVEVSDDSDL